MDLISYLRIFRRRWPLLLAPLLAAAAVAWVTLPQQAEVVPQAASYSATATMILSPTYVAEGRTPPSLATLALFTTVGEVPERAAKKLGYEGEPQVLASQFTVTPISDNGTLTIAASGADPTQIVRDVNAFAAATVEYFRDRDQSETEASLKSMERQLRGLTNNLRTAQAELAAAPADAVLEARVESLQTQYSLQYGQVISLNRQLGGSGPLDLLQPAVAIPQGDGGVYTPPSSPLARLAISAFLGLLLGGALALVVERLDARLRSREQVEEAFGLPVLAEIPTLPMGERGTRTILSSRMPASATAEAHRSLRSAVLLLGPDSGGIEAGRSANPLVVMVTSALPAEGKTTTVANLAAVMAEAGRRVLVLSMDLRNPRLHEYFDLANGVGVSDLLGPDTPVTLDAAVRRTRLAGVHLVTSGERLDHPGALLAGAGGLLAEARRRADIVLIDTPPLLTAADAVDLAQFVDVALVVSRLNRTTTAHAAATQRLLSRLGVPALGTVLVGSRSSGALEGVYKLAGLPLTHRGEAPVEEGTTGAGPNGAHVFDNGGNRESGTQ